MLLRTIHNFIICYIIYDKENLNMINHENIVLLIY